jgi:uncharacterized membrane protein YphA (DoxX/SURF4 family)
LLEVTDMINEMVWKSTVVPLVLRIALAAIFLYNGVTKISAGTDWGTNWATQFWQQKQAVPPDVLARLDGLKLQESEATIDRVKTGLGRSYAEEVGMMPEALQFSAAQLAVAWGEVVCGAALLLGLLTRLSAALMIVVQLGAIWTVTLARGFAITAGGFEYNLALLAMCCSLVLMGGGALSVDYCLSASRKKQRQKAAVQKPQTAGV